MTLSRLELGFESPVRRTVQSEERFGCRHDEGCGGQPEASLCGLDRVAFDERPSAAASDAAFRIPQGSPHERPLGMPVLQVRLGGGFHEAHAESATGRTITRLHNERPSVRMTAFLKKPLSPSSRGLGHDPLTVRTGVRIPMGTPRIIAAPCGVFVVSRTDWTPCSVSFEPSSPKVPP